MIYDYENTIDFAKKQGEAKGREEGLVKGLERGREEGLAEGLVHGRNEKSLEIARNMLKAAMSVEQISSLTGLSVEQVQSLIDEING